MDNKVFQSEIVQLFLPMLKALIDNEGTAEINSHCGEQTIVFEFIVDRPNLGFLLGKQGRMIKSFRTILTAIATKHGKRAVIEVIE